MSCDFLRQVLLQLDPVGGVLADASASASGGGADLLLVRQQRSARVAIACGDSAFSSCVELVEIAPGRGQRAGRRASRSRILARRGQGARTARSPLRASRVTSSCADFELLLRARCRPMRSAAICAVTSRGRSSRPANSTPTIAAVNNDRQDTQ